MIHCDTIVLVQFFCINFILFLLKDTFYTWSSSKKELKYRKRAKKSGVRKSDNKRSCQDLFRYHKITLNALYLQKMCGLQNCTFIVDLRSKDHFSIILETF
jgi:hypothetical protein